MNPRTLDRFFSQEWHILPDAAQTLLLSVMQLDEKSDGEPMDARPTHDVNGDAMPQLQVLDSGLAIVPIHGPLMDNATGSDKFFMGVTSYQDIADDIDTALNQGVENFLLDIMCPGGTVRGLAECASVISELADSMNVASFNRGTSASAAEYLSAAALPRYGMVSSVNGSIGSILQTIDVSKMLEKFGVTVNTFASGKYKAMGNPYMAMTDDQKDFLKGWVKNSANDFKDHMRIHRGLKDDHMEGQIFTAAQALNIGLLDEIVKSRAEVIQAIS